MNYNSKEFNDICNNSVSILFERLNRGDEYYSCVSMDFNNLIIIFEDSIIYEIPNNNDTKSFFISHYCVFGNSNKRIFYPIANEPKILDIRRKSDIVSIVNSRIFVLDKVQTIYRKQYIKNLLKDA